MKQMTFRQAFKELDQWRDGGLSLWGVVGVFLLKCSNHELLKLPHEAAARLGLIIHNEEGIYNYYAVVPYFTKNDENEGSRDGKIGTFSYFISRFCYMTAEEILENADLIDYDGLALNKAIDSQKYS